MDLSLKYNEILKENNKLKEVLINARPYNITVLSNIITHQVNEILEFSLRSIGANGNVISGDYNNIVQSSGKQENSDAVIIFWELSNIIEGLHYKANLMSNDEITSLIAHVKQEINIVFELLKKCPLVVFNKFSSLVFNSQVIAFNNFDRINNELNDFVRENLPTNFQLIDLDKIIALNSVDESVDFRFFYSSKSLYTISFYKNYSNHITPLFSSILGKAKKVLIVDCDNTLWKGVLGEDGTNGISMSSHTKEGLPFSEVQHLALELFNKGILLAICSKNNPDDVDEVLRNHPDMILKEEHFILKKVNWEDKASNIKEIAKELNLGLESIVFIDDSDFEVNLIRDHIPEVTVLQVPKKIQHYPTLFRNCMNLFFTISKSKEDGLKNIMYQEESLRIKQKDKHTSLDEYIKNLNIELIFHLDDISLVSRMSQMTQKTNQFNLTTIRYSENEINSFVLSNDYKLIALSAKDKFGDYGIIGLCILRFEWSKQLVTIDTFLLSCRIIGRKVEFSFFDYIIELLSKEQVDVIEANYIHTAKNNQVKNLYEKFGFKAIEKDKTKTTYSLLLK